MIRRASISGIPSRSARVSASSAARACCVATRTAALMICCWSIKDIGERGLIFLGGWLMVVALVDRGSTTPVCVHLLHSLCPLFMVLFVVRYRLRRFVQSRLWPSRIHGYSLGDRF